MEIPCKLIFEGTNKFISNISKLVLPIPITNDSSKGDKKPPSKRRKTEEGSTITDLTQDQSSDPPITVVWVQLNPSHTLTDTDKDNILAGLELTDIHINFAQFLLKNQFPGLNGLEPTLLLSRSDIMSSTKAFNYMQIVHSRNCHWEVISTLGCSPGTVYVYDSI